MYLILDSQVFFDLTLLLESKALALDVPAVCPNRRWTP